MKKKYIIGIIVVLLIAIGVAILVLSGEEEAPEPVVEEELFTQEILGKSVEDRDIEVYTYGNGENHLLFVGGIHGGYEWNTVLLAYEFIDYLEANSTALPDDITVSIIPNLNPDGLFVVVETERRFDPNNTPDVEATAPGRFNANSVDLNRNFDCKWQSESTWRGEVVSAGTAPFSEPEASILRDFVLKKKPKAVIFWHSQGNAVYASECENGILPETLTLMQIYADASGYEAIPSFDAYPITGDAEGWLASIGIPALTVELSTHETIEWGQNLKGIQALFNHF